MEIAKGMIISKYDFKKNEAIKNYQFLLVKTANGKEPFNIGLPTFSDLEKALAYQQIWDNEVVIILIGKKGNETVKVYENILGEIITY